MKRKYDEELLIAFLECRTVKEIAQRTGLSRSTVERRKADADFQDRLAKLRLSSIQTALNRMQLSLSDVVQQVQDIAADTRLSPQIRLNAAQILLTQCRAWTETADVLGRLEALESALKLKKGQETS